MPPKWDASVVLIWPSGEVPLAFHPTSSGARALQDRPGDPLGREGPGQRIKRARQPTGGGDGTRLEGTLGNRIPVKALESGG